MSQPETTQVIYIGKQSSVDFDCGGKMLHAVQGEPVEVPFKAAALLLLNPKLWKLADDAPEPPAPAMAPLPSETIVNGVGQVTPADDEHDTENSNI